MRIGLLSDTHIPDAVLELPAQLARAFQGVDLILHAGDIFVSSVLDQLEDIAPVLAAQGDSEYQETRTDRRVSMKHVITLEGIRIWLWHEGKWSQDGYQDPPDVIVFGHTHAPLVDNRKGILLVNPGSPTYPGYRCALGTVGLLDINAGKVEARIVPLCAEAQPCP